MVFGFVRVCGVRVLVGILPPGGRDLRPGRGGCRLRRGVTAPCSSVSCGGIRRRFRRSGRDSICGSSPRRCRSVRTRSAGRGRSAPYPNLPYRFRDGGSPPPGPFGRRGREGPCRRPVAGTGDDGDIHHLGRKGAGVEQYVLPGERIAAAGGIAGPAADVVGHGGFRFVGQQEQFVRRGVCPFN